MKVRKLSLSWATILVLATTSGTGISSPISPAGRALKGIDACFILFDLKNERLIERYGGERCAERTPPCSTFKVPLAVMGFDHGVLKDVTTTFKWDGTPQFMSAWERDQDTRSWMKNSVVWFSQKITRRLERDTMAKYLKDFGYGNADMSGGLETAWLSPEPNPKSAVQSSIAISADEQISFFAKLWRDQLPVAKRAMKLTREITYCETSPKGYALHGKTGSGYAGKGTSRRLGWFVGRLANGANEYIGVVTFTDIKEPAPEVGPGGPQSRDLFKEIVKEMGYW